MDRVNADPMLLARDERETERILRDWVEETDAVRESVRAAALGLRGKSREILDEAWASYYRFDFNGSLNQLKKARHLLASLRDTALQADTLFESLMLEGMNRRAMGDDQFGEAFLSAAALRPDALLKQDRYSPEIIRRFERANREILSGPRSTISVEADPMASRVIIDGRDMGMAPIQNLELVPGSHFIEAKRPGYEPDRKKVVLEKWQASSIDFRLPPAGPSAPPEKFFADRLSAGDSSSLKQLVRKLDVDYVILGWIDGGELKATLISGEGSPVSQAVLAAGGSRSPGGMLAMLQPLEWNNDSEASAYQGYILNVPEPGETGNGLSEESDEHGHLRWYLVLGGVVLLAVAAGSTGSGGGGTQVEVTW